jgi:MGT family glycosyltransferase
VTSEPATSRSVVVFAMGERGHYKRLRPIIAGLVGSGLATTVFTDAAFADDVRARGARFRDLFANRPLDAADDASIPIPARFVSFAGRFADDVVREVAPLRPALVVHDTFAVIGAVVAHHLGVPRVNVCAGHNLAPEPTLAALARDPRVRIAERCHRAVECLRTHHGIADASPFSYVALLSSELNLYCEPPEFLLDHERAAFAPVEFFGSLLPDATAAVDDAAFDGVKDDGPRFYASFGTVVWRYYRDAALSALAAFSDAVASIGGARGLISLGGRGTAEDAARLARPNVRVEQYVDQWQVLATVDALVTHHGLNSTHEAIWQRVPMLGYPFFSDQPGLAARCRDLGVSIPLSEELRGAVAPATVRAALARAPTLRARVAEARGWEERVMRRRPEVLARIATLAGAGGG